MRSPTVKFVLRVLCCAIVAAVGYGVMYLSCVIGAAICRALGY